jgi:hypothetical protein
VPKLWAFVLFMVAVPTFAATPVTIQQLEQILASAHGLPDGRLNKQLQDLELTERLSSDLRSHWDAQLPGAASRQTLLVLSDESAFLKPPAGELPTIAAPSLAEQSQIIARSADFAKKTISRLPDFYAARETLRFENAPAPAREPQPMHSIDTSRDTILYRDGREVVSLTATERRQYGLATPGLETNGVFGPILGSVLTDTAQGMLAWSHWEKGPQGPLAVFGYKIPKTKSHYRVELGVEYRDHPAYHGEFAVDPGTGTIFRLTIEADLEKISPVIRSGVLVEYGPVTIAGKTYTCPLNSVTINVFYPACTTTEIGACGALASVRGFKTQASLNDVNFSQYHVFRADMRILGPDSLPPKYEPNAEPVATSAGNGSDPAEHQAQVTTAQGDTAGAPQLAPTDSSSLSGVRALEKPSIKPTDVSNLPAIAAPAASTPTDVSTPVFHVTPGIVYLDVVVRDRNNHVVNGLTQNGFRILEDGHAQTIDSFRAATQSSGDHSSLGAPRATAASNASAASAPLETINIILFDLLDTSPVNQAYARTQMLKFLEALPTGQRIGLYILTGSQLRMVQNFTGNSALLAEAARQLLPESSLLFSRQPRRGTVMTSRGQCPALRLHQGVITRSFWISQMNSQAKTSNMVRYGTNSWSKRFVCSRNPSSRSTDARICSG